MYREKQIIPFATLICLCFVPSKLHQTTYAQSAATPTRLVVPPPRTVRAVIPAGRVLWAVPLTPLSSRDNRKGDEFRLGLERDLVVDGRVVLPQGSRMLARVIRVRRPGRLLLRARLRFEVFQIELPGGQRLPVSIRGPKLKGGSTLAGNFGMALSASALRRISPVSGAAQTAVGIARRGPHIYLQPGLPIPIRLERDLKVR